ncbi:MAG: GNAT family N-acetyltransferase [Aureispira sp.]|nr:GNAT family N-acetyltransferase [Aureispira sp.]
MEEPKIIQVTAGNIATEHICCAISDKKCTEGYNAKKEWLKEQFQQGFVFKKLNVRHKVFIEYVPVEAGWQPIDAPNYMLINCFWVAGSFKGKGHGKQLLQECLDDSQNMDGVVVVTGKKKMPFMSDPKFFKKMGFEKVDTALPYFELWCKRNNPNAPLPKFKETAKSGACPNKEGLTVYYSNACPFTEYWVNTMMKGIAEKKGLSLEIHKTTTQAQAHQLPVPFFIHSVFYKGTFLAQEILTEKRFDKMMAKLEGN